MNPAHQVLAHELPVWSPFAVAAGLLVGFLAGVYAMALFALWLERRATPALWVDPEQLPDPAEVRHG